MSAPTEPLSLVPSKSNAEDTRETDILSLSFEKAMAELESLVRRLEEGRLTLEDALSAYEWGTALRNHCEGKLRAAKLKVEHVLKDQQLTPQEQEPA